MRSCARASVASRSSPRDEQFVDGKQTKPAARYSASASRTSRGSGVFNRPILRQQCIFVGPTAGRTSESFYLVKHSKVPTSSYNHDEPRQKDQCHQGLLHCFGHNFGHNAEFLHSVMSTLLAEVVLIQGLRQSVSSITRSNKRRTSFEKVRCPERRRETSKTLNKGALVSRAGLEPATTALKVRCSTN